MAYHLPTYLQVIFFFPPPSHLKSAGQSQSRAPPSALGCISALPRPAAVAWEWTEK